MTEQDNFLEMFELEEPKTIKDFVLGLEKIASEYGYRGGDIPCSKSVFDDTSRLEKLSGVNELEIILQN